MNGISNLPSVGSYLVFRDTGLHVLPSRHWSIEFATLALQGNLAGFDRIFVELSNGLCMGEFLRALQMLDGDTGGVLVPRAGPVEARVPEYEGEWKPRIRPLYLSNFIPVVPDSIMTTLRWAANRGPSSPAIEFIDAPMEDDEPLDAHRDENIPFLDPQEIMHRGIPGWYSRHEGFFRSINSSSRDACREAFMAAKLRRTLQLDFGRTLFICGAAHWPKLVDLLSEERPVEMHSSKPTKREDFSVVSIDPGILFSWGLMDIPFVAGQFEKAFQRKSYLFDREASLDRLVAETHHASSCTVSTRNLLNFDAFRQRLTASSGRWSCDLDRHLLPAARAAVGETFAHTLEKKAMEYPIPASVNAPHGRVIPAGNGAYYILVGDEAHLVQIHKPSPGKSGYKRPLRTSRRDTAKKGGGWRLSGLTVKPPSEERLHKFMCDTARWLAHQLIPHRKQYRSRIFQGSLASGMDARRTIKARARGEPTLFVRQRIREPNHDASCDDCPVVWIYHPEADVAYKTGDYFASPKGSFDFYTSFFWFRQRETLQESVKRNSVAYFTRLYRNVTPSWDHALVEKQLLVRLPPERRCKTCPWHDDDLADNFEGPDLAIACAIKWAITDHVVVINTDASYILAGEILDYAAAKGIQLLTPSPDGFDGHLLNRYETDHEVPTKDHWKPPVKSALQYVEPIPGFDREDGM